MQNAFDFVGGLGLHEHCRVRVGHDFLGEGSVKMRTPVGHHRVAGFLKRSLGLAGDADNRMERCADRYLVH